MDAISKLLDTSMPSRQRREFILNFRTDENKQTSWKNLRKDMLDHHFDHKCKMSFVINQKVGRHDFVFLNATFLLLCKPRLLTTLDALRHL